MGQGDSEEPPRKSPAVEPERGGQDAQPEFLQRTVDWVMRGNRGVALKLVGVLAAGIGAILVIANASIGVYEWWERNFDRRDQQAARLARLRAGFTIKKFEQVLGTPVFDRVSRHGRYREQTFRGEEFWVQAISNRAGSVFLYAVTSCNDDFHPTFRPAGLGKSIELNKSTFSDVAPSANVGVPVDYFGSGATANSRFHEYLGGGNPGNYKTVIVGLNDACEGWFDRYESKGFQKPLPKRAPAIYRGSLSAAPSWVKRFRMVTPINTYAETAPRVDREYEKRGFQYARSTRGTFQVGASRLLTRTVDTDD